MNHVPQEPREGQATDPSLVDVMERNVAALERTSAVLVKLSERLDVIEGRLNIGAAVDADDDAPVTEKHPASQLGRLALRADGAVMLEVTSDLTEEDIADREVARFVTLTEAEAVRRHRPRRRRLLRRRSARRVAGREGAEGSLIMSLRLVGAPKPPKRRGQRRPNRLGVEVFTIEEGQRIRALIINLRRTWGSYAKIAEEIGVCPETVKWTAQGRARPSPAFAILVARLARVPLETVLKGLAVAS